MTSTCNSRKYTPIHADEEVDGVGQADAASFRWGDGPRGTAHGAPLGERLRLAFYRVMNAYVSSWPRRSGSKRRS